MWEKNTFKRVCWVKMANIRAIMLKLRAETCHWCPCASLRLLSPWSCFSKPLYLAACHPAYQSRYLPINLWAYPPACGDKEPWVSVDLTPADLCRPPSLRGADLWENPQRLMLTLCCMGVYLFVWLFACVRCAQDRLSQPRWQAAVTLAAIFQHQFITQSWLNVWIVL